jgi:hypothetical protein
MRSSTARQERRQTSLQAQSLLMNKKESAQSSTKVFMILQHLPPRYHEVLLAESDHSDPEMSTQNFGSENRRLFFYLATYVDDICVWSKDPAAVLKRLQEQFIMKGCGAPEFFLGMSMDPAPSDSTWHQAGVHLSLSLSASTYITNALPSEDNEMHVFHQQENWRTKT